MQRELELVEYLQTIEKRIFGLTMPENGCMNRFSLRHADVFEISRDYFRYAARGIQEDGRDSDFLIVDGDSRAVFRVSTDILFKKD